MVFKEVGNELPEFWQHEEEEDSIEGIFIKKLNDVGENKSIVYILEVEGILRSVWASTVIDSKMIHVTEGDRIRITYKGKEKNYKNYIVEKDE